MDRHTIEELNLSPKSDNELHSALSNFQLKWERKASRGSDDRISRF